MYIRTFARTLAGLSLLSAFFMMASAAQAATNDAGTTPAAPAATQTMPMQSSVVVKIGDATLEEYQHGNPSERTFILRGVTAGQNSRFTAESAPHEKRGS